jgi:hypothetical protein
MIARSVQVGRDFRLIAIFLLELGKGDPYQVLTRLGFSGCQFFGYFTLQFSSLTESGLDLFLNLAALVLQCFLLRG